MIMIGAGVAALVVIGVVVAWRSRNETVLQIPTAPPQPIVASTYTLPELAALAETGKLVEVTNPLVLRSMEKALERGGPMARYIVRYQGALWITFEPLPDQQEREQAYELFRRFNTGEELDIRALMKVIRKIGK